MQVINFSSYFELFASLCIGYAGFQYFRDQLENRVFKLSIINNALTNLISDIKAYILDNNDEELIKGLENTSEIIRLKNKQVKYKENYSKNFFNLFKAIALIGFLYCLTAIIFGGFQATSYHKQLYFYILGLLGFSCFGINLYIFVVSIYKPIKNLNTLLVLCFFIIALLISSIICCNKIGFEFLLPCKEIISIILKISILLSPISLFILLFFRVGVHRYYYLNEYTSVSKEYSKEFRKIKAGFEARQRLIDRGK